MLSIQIAVLGYHLRLNPYPELHAKRLNSFHKLGQTALYLVLIYYPVSKSGIIRVALSEPSVVKHKHVKPDILCFFCYFIQLFLIKIKISRFPIVYQYRSGSFHIFTPNQVGAVRIMVNARETPQPFI